MFRSISPLQPRDCLSIFVYKRPLFSIILYNTHIINENISQSHSFLASTKLAIRNEIQQRKIPGNFNLKTSETHGQILAEFCHIKLKMIIYDKKFSLSTILI